MLPEQPLRPDSSTEGNGSIGANASKQLCVTASGRRKISDMQIQADAEICANDGDAEADGDELQAEEETEVKHILPTPVLPSQKDIDEHWLNHLPYRPWCGTCVGGRGRERPHLRTGEKRKIPTLAFDYCFLSKDGTFTREEWSKVPEGTEGTKILVATEIVSKCTFAHVVKCKGIGEDRYSVDCLVRDIEWMGHTRIMLRSDNERAIVSLLKESLRALRVDVDHIEQTAEEHPPEYDPQANGAVENAVGRVKGLLRTYTLAMESRLGHRVPPDHPVIAWMVQHVAFNMNVSVKSDDGLTAYERIRMRPFTTRMLECCEYCRHKLGQRDNQREGTLAARWGYGVFLGMCTMTGRYFCWDGDKIAAARSVLRVPDSQK